MPVTTSEQRAAWLETLQPGDQVAVLNLRNRRHYLRQILSISQIKRWIQISGYSLKFSRRGEAADFVLLPVTDEIRADIDRRRLMNEVRSFDLDSAPIEVLQRIREVQKASGVGYKTPASWVQG